MARIRIEWVPIQVFNLGLLGFDHLHLVFEQDESDLFTRQDSWWVIEGERDATGEGIFLSVLGTDGRTSLAAANLAARENLIAKIGTPDDRGSRIIPFGGGEFVAWDTMAEYAAEIHNQDFHYITLQGPVSPLPTMNSSSVIASVLHAAGVDISENIPFGMRRSPGTHTLIGTSGDDELAVNDNFTTLVGGWGRDVLEGSDSLLRVDKLYGGADDDLLKWSPGINILHGGLYGLKYEEDGTDTVDYAGVGNVTIRNSPYSVPHYLPDFIASHDHGWDLLFSIERIQWKQGSDNVTMGEGLGLIEDNLLFDMGTQPSGAGDKLDLSDAADGVLVNAASADMLFLQAVDRPQDDQGVWIRSAEWLVGSSGDDRIYMSAEMRGVEGGSGNDVIDAREVAAFSGLSPQGFDAEIAGGDGDDILISGVGRTWATGGAGADWFVLGGMTDFELPAVEFIIENADEDDRLFVPYNFFNGSEAGFAASELMPLLGSYAFSDPAEPVYFLWQLTDNFFYAEFDQEGFVRSHFQDEPEGIITFYGKITYVYEDDDLVIRLYQGGAQEENYEINWTGATDTYLKMFYYPDTETVIRIKDFQEKQLGIAFYDPGEELEHDPEGSRNYYYYANHDDIVRTVTNDGELTAALEARPTPPPLPPEDNETGNAFERDLIVGTNEDDVIIALLGASKVEAGDGDDYIETGPGNDILNGGSGSDEMRGGSGNDVYYVEHAGDIVIEAARGGFDTIVASIDYALPDNVEHLELAGSAAHALGNALNNRLIGNNLDNLLEGGDGDDTLFGGLGNDTLIGGDGSDGYVYVAGDGADIVIDDGPGTDTDVLVFGWGITPADVTFFVRSDAPDDLVLSLAFGGRIVIADFLASGHAGIDRVEFADAPAWTRQDLDAFAAAAPVIDNDAPQAVEDPYLAVLASSGLITAEALLANDRDFDGDPLTIVSVQDVSQGTAAVTSNGDVQLTLPGEHDELITFTYTIADGQGGFSTATAEVAIIPNATPTAVDDDGLSTYRDVALTVAAASLLANDTDLDGDTLSIADVGGAEHGTVALDGNGNVVFTPEEGYTGAASFAYAVSDGKGGRATATAGLTVASSPQGSTITGTSGNDTLNGTIGNDTLSGLGGADLIYGGAGDDLILAGIGGDTAYGGFGDDRIEGGDGDDYLYGDAGNDVLLGESGADRLYGGSGNDELYGGNSNDFLYGEDGDDLLSGGDGNDELYGGAGNDTLSGDAGTDYLDGGDGNDILTGGGSADTLIGGGGDDTLYGDAGNDTLDGGSGSDMLYGGTGSDVLLGEAGDDALYGDDGADTLDGGSGDDVLTGGLGNDTFVFKPGFGHDLIVDFTNTGGEHDRVEFDTAIFADFTAVQAASAQAGSDVVITFDAANTITLASVSLAGLDADDFRFV